MTTKRNTRPRGLVQTSSVMFKLTPNQKHLIQYRPYHALSGLRSGTGSVYSLKTIKIRTLYARLMASVFNESDEIKAKVELAHQAIESAVERFKTDGVWLTTESEFEALRQALGVADSIDDHSTRHTQYHAYTKAVELTERDPVFKI